MAAKVNSEESDRFVGNSWDTPIATSVMLASNGVFLSVFLCRGVPVVINNAKSRAKRVAERLGLQTENSAKKEHEANMTLLHMDGAGRRRRRSITDSDKLEWESRHTIRLRLEDTESIGTAHETFERLASLDVGDEPQEHLKLQGPQEEYVVQVSQYSNPISDHHAPLGSYGVVSI